MDIEKKKNGDDDAVMLSAEELDAAAKAESEMEKEVPVLKGKGSIETEHTVETEMQQIMMLSTRSTADNWKLISDKVRKLGKAGNVIAGLRELVKHVPHLQTHCDDVEKLAQSTDDNSALLAAFNINSYISEVHTKVQSMHNQLVVLSGWTQAERSCAGTSTGKRSRVEYSDTDYKVDVQVLPARLESGSVDGLECVGALERFDSSSPPIGDFDKLRDNHKAPLKLFSAALESCFQRDADIFNDVNQPDENTYKKTLCTLEGILRDTPTVTKDSDHLRIPGPLAPEFAFAQPYLLVVLQALGSVIDNVPVDGSPAKTMVQTNRIVPKTQLRRERVADKSIAANGRYIFLLRDDLVEIPVEEKPGERKGISPEHLCHECTDQILSHLAKQVGIAFNFAGIGIDARATGVVLTPAYVKIVQLRLENMGTNEMKLTKLETNCLPLLSQKSFEEWVKGRESRWTAFKSILYGDGTPTNGVSSNGGVPSGLVALWNLMTTSRSVLVGPSPSHLNSDVLGYLIGFGSFATVHQAKGKENHVMKLSQYGAKATLERESSVLRALQGPQTAPAVGIPRLVDFKKLSFSIGGIGVQLPALILAPRGISVEMHLAQNDGNGKDKLLAIGKDLMSALGFIHGKGYHHNDVSPKNILFDPIKGKAFLIDFGLASSHSRKIKGFRGTPRYVHRAIFPSYPSREWKPMPVYDKSSLALSMAVLSNQGKDLWKSFQPFDIADPRNAGRKEDFYSWADKRSRSAWSCLEKNGFTSDWESFCSDGVAPE